MLTASQRWSIGSVLRPRLSSAARQGRPWQIREEMLAVLSTHLRADKNLSPKTVDVLQDLLGALERLMDSRAERPTEDENGE